jgi:hypothetical protein
MTALEQQYAEIRGQLKDRAAIETLDAVFADWAHRNPYRFAQHLALFREMLTPEYRERRAKVEMEIAAPRERHRETESQLDDALTALQSMPQMAEQL